MKRKIQEKELKGEDGNWIVTNVQNITSNTAAPWREICKIDTSTAITGREGNRIQLKSVRARGIIKTTFQPLNGQYQDEVLRVMFIRIENPTNMPGATFAEQSNPKWGQLFTLTTSGGVYGEVRFLGFPDLNLGSTIKILKEKFIRLKPPVSGQTLSGTMSITDGTGTGSTTQQMENQVGQETYELYCDVNRELRFDSSVSPDRPIQNLILLGIFRVSHVPVSNPNIIDVNTVYRARWTE